MARKDLLKDLMAAASGKDEDGEKRPTPAPAPPARMTGAIGAVSQSIEALKARSLLDIDPFQIDAGGLQDRLENDDADDAALMASIKQYGQQVPVLVRPHPDEKGRYQIVYGRRRVLALRDLGQPVKALVRDLDDGQLVMAQGQENSARRDLSFIEKSNFAAQMRDAGYKRQAICDALNVDKTQISRMLSIVDRIGLDLIEVIGAAPQIGRDRWSILANEIEERQFDQGVILGTMNALAEEDDSNVRFEAALSATGYNLGKNGSNPPKPPAPSRGRQSRRKIKSTATGIEIATALARPDKVVVTINRADSGGFEDWLLDNLEEIHGNWIRLNNRDEQEQ